MGNGKSFFRRVVNKIGKYHEFYTLEKIRTTCAKTTNRKNTQRHFLCIRGVLLMVASYNFVLDLFIDCNLIRESCNRLQSEAEKMQEVSMNAAIAAGHTGSYIRTFAEIARQIGNSSTRLSTKIQKTRGDTNRIVNETLRAMIWATHLSYFERSISAMGGDANIEIVRNRMESFEVKVSGSLETIFRDLQTILSDLKAVDEIQRRVWAVITRLRIEAAAMDPSEQVFVSSIADSLSESIDRAVSIFRKLMETVKDFEEKLTNSRKENRFVQKARLTLVPQSKISKRKESKNAS